jgi:hypothetical protein
VHNLGVVDVNVAVAVERVVAAVAEERVIAE